MTDGHPSRQLLSAVFVLFACSLARYAHAQRGELSPEVKERVQAATALVHVYSGSGSSSGTAFLIDKQGERGLFATNAAMLFRGGLTPERTRVVLFSGTDNETAFDATLAGYDDFLNTALLEVVSADLPQPIAKAATELKETADVYAFGFPTMENRDMQKEDFPISVRRSRVSSLRRNDDQHVIVVQLDEHSPPGGNGSPIVSLAGDLVGVADSRRDINDLGMVLPGASYLELPRGYATGMAVSREREDEKEVTYAVQARVIDPFERIAKLELGVFQFGSSVAAKFDARRNYDFQREPAQVVDMVVSDHVARAKVTVKKGEINSRFVNLQFFVHRRDGDVLRTKPVELNIGAEIPRANASFSDLARSGFSDDWLTREIPQSKDAAEDAPRPAVTEIAAVQSEVKAADLTIQRLIAGKGSVADPCFSHDGTSLYIASPSEGLLQIRVADMKCVRRLAIPKPLHLRRSREGLVLVLEGNLLWVVDESTLEVKKVLTAPRVRATAVSPAASLALVEMDIDTRQLALADLAAGRVGAPRHLDDISQQLLAAVRPSSGRIHLPKFTWSEMSSDGKHIFGVGEGVLYRFALRDRKLVLQEASPYGGFGKPEITKDGRLILVPSDCRLGYPSGKEDQRGISVFDVSDLQLEKNRLPVEAALLAVDSTRRLVYALKRNGLFTAVRANGETVSSFYLPGEDLGEPLAWSLAPDNGALCLITTKEVYFFAIPSNLVTQPKTAPALSAAEEAAKLRPAGSAVSLSVARLQSEPRDMVVDQVSLRELALPGDFFNIGGMTFSSDGNWLYVYYHQQALKVRFPELTIDRLIVARSGQSWAGVTQEHILYKQESPFALTAYDHETFEFARRIAVDGIKGAPLGNNFVAVSRSGTVRLFDVSGKGTAVDLLQPEELMPRGGNDNVTIRGLICSPDGKRVFVSHGPFISRYRFDDNRLQYEESTEYEVFADTPAIGLSGDGKVVIARRGVPGAEARNFEVILANAGNFRDIKRVLPANNFIAADPKGNVYSADKESMAIFNSHNERIALLRSKGSLPIRMIGLMAHPSRAGVLMLTDKHVRWIDLERPTDSN